MSIRRYRDRLLERWWFPCLGFLCVGVGSLLGALTTPPVYEATALIQIDVPVTNTTAVIAITGTAYTQAGLATTSPVLSAVAPKYQGLSEERLRSKVSAAPVANSALVEITVRDSVPARASSLANDIANTLVVQQIAALKKNNLAAQQSVRSAIDATSMSIQTTSGELAQLVAAKGNQSQIATKRTELDSLNATYTVLLATLGAIELNQEDTSQFMHVAKPADASLSLIRSFSLSTFAYGALFGFLLGVVVVLLYDIWNGGILSVEDLERLLNLPVLTRLSAKSREPTGSNGASTHLDPSDLEYQELETALAFLSIEQPLRALAINSVGDEESKRQIAEGMALSSASLGQQTLLVNADLRQLTQQENVEQISALGLSEAIVAYQSPATPMNAIEAYYLTPGAKGTHKLRVLPAGAAPPRPSRLLATPAARRAFRAIFASEVEAIVIDTLPVLGQTESLEVCALADGALLVVRLGAVRWSEALEARKRLVAAGAHPLGCIAVQAETS